ASRLAEDGRLCLTLRLAPPAHIPDPFTNFFTTYNRTLLQEQVKLLVQTCALARNAFDARRVVLCGLGHAGLSTLLAAPAADAVAVDCAQLDDKDDKALLAPDLFCPGLRNIGSFQAAPMLAAPHPLLLHNVGNNFPVEDIRAAYRALSAMDRFRHEAHASSGD